MPLPEIAIQSQRLELRPVSSGDIGYLMEINGDPEVTRFLPYATWKTLADAEAWFERMDRLSRETGSRQLVVVRAADRKVVGTLLVFNHDETSKRVELGYVIGSSYWRQGYAREMLRTLLDHLFDVHGVRRVEAEVNPGNVASTSLLRNLGFNSTKAIFVSVTSPRASSMASTSTACWPANGRRRCKRRRVYFEKIDAPPFFQ